MVLSSDSHYHFGALLNIHSSFYKVDYFRRKLIGKNSSICVSAVSRNEYYVHGVIFQAAEM